MKLLATFCTGLLFLVLGVATIGHTQEQKEEAKPEEAHPGAAAPRQEGAPPRPEARPQAEPAGRPAPNNHEERAPEARSPQEHPQPERPSEVRPPQERAPQAGTPHEPAHQETAPPKQEVRPPEPPRRTAAPEPATTPRPQPEARPAAEPPRTTAEHRGAAPTADQQRDWERHRVNNWQAEHQTWRERGGYRGYRIPQERYQAYFGPPHVFRIYEYPVTFYQGYPRFQYGNYWVQVVDPWPNYWASDWFYNDPVYVTYLDDGYYLVDTRYPDYPLAVEIFS